MIKETPRQSIYAELQKPNNKFCADCKSSNPRWSSTKFGIFLCRKCADIHKSVFPNDDKIKSIDNSEWNRADTLIFKTHGNKKSNDYYEYNFNPNDRPKRSNSEAMTQFINDKYVQKKWAHTNKDQKNINSNIDSVTVIIISIFISLIIIFTLRLTCEKSHSLIKAISLEFIILFEVLSIKEDIYKLNPFLMYQVLYGFAGFGLINGFIVVLVARLIRVGLSLEKKGLLLFAAASILIFIRFGLMNLLIVLFSSGIIIFILKKFVSEVPKADLTFAQLFLE